MLFIDPVDEINKSKILVEEKAKQVDALNENIFFINQQHQDTMNLLRESDNHVEDLKQNI